MLSSPLSRLDVNAICRPSGDQAGEELVPNLVREAGQGARFAYDEFFFGRLRNVYTRRNYRQAVHGFLKWCESSPVVF